MKKEIKERIEAVRRGEVPEGFYKDYCLMPNSWKTVELKKIAQKVSKKNKDGEDIAVLSNSAVRGVVLQREYFEKDIANDENTDGYFVVEPRDYIYNPRISVHAPFGPINRNNLGHKGIVSPLYTVFRPEDYKTIDQKYLEYFFLSTRWNRFVYTVSNQGVRFDRMNITDDDFFCMPIVIPPLVEQQKIAEILATCDRVIELKEQLLEEKQRQKRAYLQKMLPQNGCDVPEWRLPGFYSPWQKKKLGELVTFYNGLTYSPDDIRAEGTLVLRSSNVKDGEIVDADNVYVDSDAVNSENVQIGDIIVVVRNGSRALIGKHAEIKADMPNTVIGAFMTGIRSEYPLFVNVLLSTPQFDKEVEKNLGAAINQITGYMFAKMEFMVPEPAERVAIGEFFRTIDDLIALHQRELEQEKQKKEALMQFLLTGLVRV